MRQIKFRGKIRRRHGRFKRKDITALDSLKNLFKLRFKKTRLYYFERLYPRPLTINWFKPRKNIILPSLLTNK